MEVVKSISELQSRLDSFRAENKTIGFVPTMGALHEGHLSLVAKCVEDNDVCVVSIFVNPTQFNNENDLLKYPRTEQEDCELLERAGCSVVFMPEVNEMYPEPDTRIFEFGELDKVMEGRFRPGHFNGVAQIVSKLFDIIQPKNAYFGEKDFQQLAIIRKMTEILQSDINIVACPIVREKDGLAMSSRNRRLSSEQRKEAVTISRALFESKKAMPAKSVEELKADVIRVVDSTPGLKTEYFDIADGRTLQPVSRFEETDYVVGCIAVFCGEIRLIDNIVYKP